MSRMMNIMMRMMSFIIPQCDEASHIISMSQDEKLPFGKRLGLKMHLLVCQFCRRYARQLENINNLIHKSSDEFESSENFPGLSPDSKNRLKDLLDNSQ